MNKEEMLTTLENIQSKIADANIGEYELEDRVQILEYIFTLRERYQADVKYLKENLSNEDNYLETTSALYDESMRFNLEDYLEACKGEEQTNLDNIARYEALIEQLESNIDAQEIESKKIVDTLNAELAEQGEDLRDSEDMGEEEFQQLRESINYNTMLRDAYSQNITESRAALERYKEKLENFKGQTQGFEEARKQAEEDLAKFDERVAKGPQVDQEKKNKDEALLAQREAQLKNLEFNEKMTSYDHEKEIASIIADYKSGKITDAEVVERVKDFRSYVVDEFLEEDINKRYGDEEIQKEVEANQKAQEECEKEIARLESKLANDDNYAVSAFIVERNNRQVKKLAAKISKIDDQIKSYNDEMEAMQQDIDTSDMLIREAEQDKLNIQRQIRRLGVNITPEVEQDLLEQLASKDADIAYLQSVKIESSRNLEHNANELSYLKSKQDRYTELHTRLSASLEKRNSIDSSTKRLDEMEVTRLKADLEALKRREKIVGVSIYEDLDSIINAKLTSNKELTEEENKELEDFLNNLEPVKKDEKTAGETSKEEIEEEKDPIVADKKGKMEFKDQGENEKLSKKAKNKGFIAKLKKWWKVITAAVALVLLVTGLKSCSTSDINSKIKDIQENPTRYENMTEDELKDDIEIDLGVNEKETVEKTDEAEETLEDDKVSLKSNDDIAKEVIKGQWGNGQERIDRLTEAGYDADAIQDMVNDLFTKPEVNTNEGSTMNPEDIAPAPVIDSNTTVTPGGTISKEEQDAILKEEGIIPSVDAPVTTVVDNPTYDYDVNDENSYGGFQEDSNVQGGTTTDGTTGGTTTDETTNEDDWGEFHEEEVITPNTPSDETPSEDVIPEEPTVDSDTFNVTVNNGETLTLNIGGETYELNNSDRESSQDASSFIELDDTRNLTEDEKGSVNLEISGDSAEELKRDEPLTLEEIQKIRDELAAQLGQETLTQEEVDQINAEYQESTKSR